MSQPTKFKPRNPLLQPDVFLHLLDSLDAPEQYHQSRGIFCALARTCRAFSEPALDHLWYMLQTLDPLIQCYATVFNEETAKTPPSEEEWTIIRRYSHRVKELSVSASTKYTFCFLQAISLRPSSLLPNLRILIWQPWLFGETHLALPMLIQPLLSPTLTALRVEFSGRDDPMLHSFLANYPLRCPNLKAVDINLGKNPAVSHTTIKVISRAIIHSQHLECVELAVPIDDVAFMHFALSPKLTKLTTLTLVLHPDKSNLHQVSIPPDATPFRSVKNLKLHIWDIHFVTNLLRSQDQGFHSFDIYHHTQPSIEAVYALFAALVSSERTHSLHSVAFQPGALSTERGQFTEERSVSCDIIQPFFSLRHLRRLVVDLGHWISMDDDDLVPMASNWPSLEILHFNCVKPLLASPWKTEKYITFKGFFSLHKICPNLTILCIPVDARKLDFPMDKTDLVRCPKLTSLRFPSSPIRNSRVVKKLLARCFPSVGEVDYWFNQKEDSWEIGRYRALWENVNDYLARLAYEGPGPDDPDV